MKIFILAGILMFGAVFMVPAHAASSAAFADKSAADVKTVSGSVHLAGGTVGSPPSEPKTNKKPKLKYPKTNKKPKL